MTVIGPFENEFAFLSNFYEVNFIFEGRGWTTSEHAYQADKTDDEKWKQKVQYAKTPGISKRLGRKVPIKINWDNIRYDRMTAIVRAKFEQNPWLFDKLKATAGAELVEKNWWNDTYWGECKGVGENNLGKILMDLREKGI